MTPPPAIHMVKPCVVVIAAVAVLAGGACGRIRRPRSRSVSLSRPRCFRSVDQRRRWAGRSAGAFCVDPLPSGCCAGPSRRVRDLDEAHAGLGEAPGQQALACRNRAVAASSMPYSLLRRRRSRPSRSSTPGTALCMRNASSYDSITPSTSGTATPCAMYPSVQRLDQVELIPLRIGARCPGWRCSAIVPVRVWYGRALVRGGQKRRAVILAIRRSRRD